MNIIVKVGYKEGVKHVDVNAWGKSVLRFLVNNLPIMVMQALLIISARHHWALGTFVCLAGVFWWLACTRRL